MATRRDILKLGLSGAAGLSGLGPISELMAKDLNSTPQADGFRFPAEWEPHEFCIMQFVPAQNWGRYGIAEAQRDWASVANAVNEYEPVLMVVDPADRRAAERLLSRDIETVELPLNDGWARDSAPLFLLDDAGRRRSTHFVFNGWGEKFPPFDDDARLKARLSAFLDEDNYRSPLVAEGGAITQNGDGTLISTEECLLNPNRNPGWSKADVTEALKTSLNIEQVIWLPRGLTPDPITDGHIDGLCVFVGPETVMLHTTDDRSDPNHAICEEARQILTNSRTASGKPLEIIELPLADTVAHINFYIANDAVIVPTAGQRRQDNDALAVIRETFPERDVIGVGGQILAEGGGGVHCITQQVPLKSS